MTLTLAAVLVLAAIWLAWRFVMIIWALAQDKEEPEHRSRPLPLGRGRRQGSNAPFCPGADIFRRAI